MPQKEHSTPDLMCVTVKTEAHESSCKKLPSEFLWGIYMKQMNLMYRLWCNSPNVSFYIYANIPKAKIQPVIISYISPYSKQALLFTFLCYISFSYFYTSETLYSIPNIVPGIS